MRKPSLVLLLLIIILMPVAGRGDDLGMKALPWGLTLEELDRVFREKVNPGAALREDPSVPEIELQLRPNKTMKVALGNLRVVQEISREARPGAVGRPFGYLWEGKFFGRVVPYANHPGTSRTQIVRELKAQFPEGRLFHKFVGGLMVVDFELDSDKLLIFTTEQAVYLYEPAVLKRVIREEGRSQQERYDRDAERRFLEHGKSPL
jgi:hypothetical protein